MSLRFCLGAFTALVLSPLSLQAEEISADTQTVLTGKEAHRILFRAKRVEARVTQELKDADLIDSNMQAILEQVGKGQKYYGAIAFSEDLGVMSEATVAAANYHSLARARQVAREGCEAAAVGKCIVAVEIVPRRYKEGAALTLSQDATQTFINGYRKAKSPKAFAISQETGQFAWAASEADAKQECEKEIETDCFLILRD